MKEAKVRIIPCLDIKQGRVVKGTQFLDLRDAGDPLELAKYYAQEGADELVFLNIAATKDEEEMRLSLLRAVTSSVSLPCLVGGGIHTLAGIDRILAAGATRVSLGTVAVEQPELLCAGVRRFGGQRLTVAIDSRQVGEGKWEVYTRGGQKPTGLDVREWALRVAELGVGEILLTSMDRDGTQDGYDLALTKMVSAAVSLPVIASGGVGKKEHFWEGAVLGGATGLLAASVFHYGTLQIAGVKKYLQERDVQVCI